MIKYNKLSEEKLLSFGFEKCETGYVYVCGIMDGQMNMMVSVSLDGKISTKLTDRGLGEEYILHRVPSATGSFVGQVKLEYEAVLDKIVTRCFDSQVFKSEQAKEVIAYVYDKYGDELEHLWQRFPDNAIVRRKDNKKWYVAILKISRRKLGFDSDEFVEIVDLRIEAENIEKTVDNVKYFHGYHMNKKHWITICLDGTVNIEEIFRKIDKSYSLARK